jgi:hypothetical protein
MGLGEGTGTKRDGGGIIVLVSFNGIAFPPGSVAVLLEQ